MTGFSDSGSSPAENPYVGPRPFEPGETLYGREDEINDLYYLWHAERIVLLCSPSGAGKSSLLQAGLLPRLKDSFDILGPTRVHLDPQLKSQDGVNRYVLSTILGFEESVPERLRRSPDELAHTTLVEYFEKRPRRRKAPKNVAILFDQFEETLTVDPLAIEEKHAFFAQLGELLHDRRIWALFAIREDYLAPLDPYAHHIPTSLKNRFRINLLGLDAAHQAIVQPARQAGREFAAAERLVQDLATMKVQREDGSFKKEVGHHVEPVQLQVVCFRLWNQLPPDDRVIGEEDLERFGDVSEALGAYYSESVARLAKAGAPEGSVSLERTIRTWFGQRLITTDGIRGQVLRGTGESEGLANEVVGQLLDTHLVRAEKRAGATWYELAHDRLVDVVRTENQRWRDENLVEVQRRAEIWTREGRPPGLLLSAKELEEAKRWTKTAPVVTENERDFLKISNMAHEAEQRARRDVRRIQFLGKAAIIGGILAMLAGVVAIFLMYEADKQRDLAESALVVAKRERAEAHLQREEARAQKAEAIRQSDRAEEKSQEAQVARNEALVQKQEALEQAQRAERKEEEAQEARQRAVTAQEAAELDRQRAVAEEKKAEEEKERADRAAAENERLRLLAEAEALAIRTTNLQEEAYREFSALLALAAHRVNLRYEGGTNAEIYNAMRLAFRRLGGDREELLAEHSWAVRSLAISSDGNWVASGDENGEVRMHDIHRVEDTQLIGRFPASVRALAFRPDLGKPAEDRLLAVGGADGVIYLSMPNRSTFSNQATEHRMIEFGAVVQDLLFLPGSSRLVGASADGRVRIWDVDTEDPEAFEVPMPETASGAARALSVRGTSADGDGLLAIGRGNDVVLWREATSEVRLLKQASEVHAVAFHVGGERLAVGLEDGTILVSIVSPEGATKGAPASLFGHQSRVTDLEYHPLNGILASSGLDGTLRSWNEREADTLPVLLAKHDSWIWAATFTPDGKRLVVGGQDHSVSLLITNTKDLAAALCAKVAGTLTPEDWEEYLPGVEPEDVCPMPLEREGKDP